ncbi:MAG: asparagine synthase (glutamine-hydrolyzing) [Alphaproteobacteria bacterium]|nr:asparagine synthase (glutamine-hydrolyzing) [Alphaproteobacteria bacterium]
MCGIAGIFAYAPDASRVRRGELVAIRDAMAVRGPDGTGEWFSDDGRVGFGHRRLSIIDLRSIADQPMRLAGTGLHIVFNGEIYNYRALRDELIAEGAVFSTESDTEVILHLYERRGPEKTVAALRGMFAFAVFDPDKGGMFFARDPFGIKPLYLADDGRTIRFASQVKALLAADAPDTTPNPAGHAGFFVWGHVPDPHTLYRGIVRLPAGTALWVDAHGQGKQKPYFDLVEALRGAGEASDLRSAVVDTLAHHMVADVKVGVFLSAGIDSTVLAGIAAETIAGRLDTVTLGFDSYRGTENDETVLAEQFAKARGTNHRTIWIGRDAFAAERDNLFAAMDQPSVDGINTYFVARAAKQAGLKVALSGLGGDEVFAGYPGFGQIPSLVARTAPFAMFGGAFRALTQGWIGKLTSPKYAGLLEYGASYEGAYLLRRALFMPWEIEGILGAKLAREGLEALDLPRSLDKGLDRLHAGRLKVSALEIANYMRDRLLRDSDWAGMAQSIEIRVPFVDPVFLAKIAPALNRADAPGKRDLGATPQPPLPPEILDRPKTGFVVPVREWLMGDASPEAAQRGLRGWAHQVHRAFV